MDYFRGLAIICVVLYHLISLYMKSLPGIIRFATNARSSGVLVFFFCSGFSLWLSEYRRKRSSILGKQLLKNVEITNVSKEEEAKAS